MACFIAPVAESIVVGFLEFKAKKKERTENIEHVEFDDTVSKKTVGKYSQKLYLLRTMLTVGSIILILQHIYTGELIASFPFFTAILNGNVIPMLLEIVTEGGLICLGITALWTVIVKVTDALKGRSFGKQII